MLSGDRPMVRKLSDREILILALGAPVELWLSIAALFLAALFQLSEAPLEDDYLFGGTALRGTCISAMIGVLIATLGDFRGLLIAIAAFVTRAVLYHFYLRDPLGDMLVAPFNIDPRWTWSAIVLPTLLLLPCASPRVVRFLRREWPRCPTRRGWRRA